LSGHSARLRSACFSRFECCALLFWTFFQAYSRDGSKILTSSDDGSARLWSVETGEQFKEFKGHSKKLCSASFSNDGTKLFSSFQHSFREDSFFKYHLKVAKVVDQVFDLAFFATAQRFVVIGVWLWTIAGSKLFGYSSARASKQWRS
jgi:WD40 repeat protein